MPFLPLTGSGTLGELRHGVTISVQF